MRRLETIANRLGIPVAVLDTFYPLDSTKLRGWLYRFRLRHCGWATVVHPYVVILGGYNVSVGEYSALNAFVHIWGHKGVHIGDRVMIASHVSIVSVTHDHTADSMRFAAPIGGPVRIEDDVWLGSQVVVMPGVTIGRGAVIGAGAIVRDDIPPYAIAVGMPARVIRYRTAGQVADAHSVILEQV